ncbi:hypothetical protein PAXRUDRAFT_487311 [Paxillus rubicundulus Ve08.2h10]|uniref:Uncharacterized protein n=1 Tax=Paxillus rubicundulus Ve08.2h10 TaxID=930991 RepID=A0A0D0E7E0_9AGAM|nr:hypothetical protein PAXRUDRAFT_487311 [Paxillus rubicundulus Ve08.2h10]
MPVVRMDLHPHDQILGYQLLLVTSGRDPREGNMLVKPLFTISGNAMKPRRTPPSKLFDVVLFSTADMKRLEQNFRLQVTRSAFCQAFPAVHMVHQSFTAHIFYHRRQYRSDLSSNRETCEGALFFDIHATAHGMNLWEMLSPRPNARPHCV